MNLSDSDLKTLEARGITPEELQTQVDRFVTGFPYLKIHDSARPGEGITVLTDDDETRAMERLFGRRRTCLQIRSCIRGRLTYV